MLKKWMVDELINLVWKDRGECAEECKKYVVKEGMSYSRDWYERKEYWENSYKEMNEILKILEDM